MPDIENEQQKNPSPAQIIADLATERQARKVLEKKLREHSERFKQLQSEPRRYEAVDPEHYQQLLEAQSAREEQDLLNKMEFEQLRQRYQTETETAKKHTETWQQKHQKLLVKNAIEAAFFGAGGKRFDSDSPDELQPIELIASILESQIKFEGDSVYLSELNADGYPKSLLEKMLELKKGSLANFFAAESAGSGASPKNYTREQARAGRASIDDIASGKAVIY